MSRHSITGTTLLAVALLAATAVQAGITPQNPTGVHLSYTLAWLNPATGNFGGNLTVAELAPSTPAAVFSLKYFFQRPDTMVQDYWGDWRLTHYQSGAYHIQPGAASAGPNATRTYLFNGLYNTTVAASNATFAMPSAMALLRGVEYTSPETAFQLDDIRVPPVPRNLPTAPFGPFVRPERNSNSSASADASNGNAGDDAQKSDGAGAGGNTAYFVGGGVAAAVLAAVIVGLVAMKRRKSNGAAVGKKDAEVARKGSFRGTVNQGAVEPNVQQMSPVTVTGPMDVGYGGHHAAMAGIGAASHNSVSRQQEQLDFVEQYASTEFRDEMDVAVAHGTFAHGAGQDSYYASEAGTNGGYAETAASTSYSSQDMIGRIEEEEKRLQQQLDSASAAETSAPVRSRSPMLKLSGVDDHQGYDDGGADELGDAGQYAMAYEAVEFDSPSGTTAHNPAPGPNYI